MWNVGHVWVSHCPDCVGSLWAVPLGPTRAISLFFVISLPLIYTMGTLCPPPTRTHIFSRMLNPESRILGHLSHILNISEMLPAQPLQIQPANGSNLVFKAKAYWPNSEVPNGKRYMGKNSKKWQTEDVMRRLTNGFKCQRQFWMMDGWKKYLRKQDYVKGEKPDASRKKDKRATEDDKAIGISWPVMLGCVWHTRSVNAHMLWKQMYM